SPEVIEPDDVDRSQRMPDPFDPPAVPVLLHQIPTVERVRPQLPRLAEIVRGYPRDLCRTALGVQVKLLSVRPHVRAVMRDEDRGVPDDLHAVFVRIPGESEPLFEEKILIELLRADLDRMILAKKMHRLVFAISQVGIPTDPFSSLVRALDRPVNRV